MLVIPSSAVTVATEPSSELELPHRFLLAINGRVKCFNLHSIISDSDLGEFSKLRDGRSNLVKIKLSK